MAERRVPVATPTRLDAVVRTALPTASRRLVRTLIDEGAVRVDGRRVRKGTVVAAGATVTVPELPSAVAPEPSLAVPVVYEDDALVVLDKPGGMPGHALDPRERGTVAGFLLARHPELATVGDPLAAGLVHRLDTGTSGLLLAARTPAAWDALRAALRGRRVEKGYLALVDGTPAELRIDVALAHDPRDRRRMVAARPGLRSWPATTELCVRGPFGRHTLVAVTIRTGVTHQVRAHLGLAGAPVAGDALYGGGAVRLPPGRHALHASRVRLPHPTTGETLTLESALPADLAALASDGD